MAKNSNRNKKTKATKVTTPDFIVSYPAVFEAKENLNGVLKYSVSMIFPEDTNLSRMKKAAKAAVIAKFGNSKSDWPKKIRMPFRDGNEDRDGDGPYNIQGSGGSIDLFASLIADINAPFVEV